MMKNLLFIFFLLLPACELKVHFKVANKWVGQTVIHKGDDWPYQKMFVLEETEDKVYVRWIGAGEEHTAWFTKTEVW